MAQPANFTLDIGKPTVDAVTVSWSGTENLTASGWIGLYADPCSPDNKYATFQYIKPGFQGSLSFATPTVQRDTYEFRFFPYGAYDKHATSAPVKLGRTPSSFKLAIDKSMVTGGSAVTVTWSGAESVTASGWIGLYPDSRSADTAYVVYQNIQPGLQGSQSYTMPAELRETYEFRFFPFGAYDKRATSAPVKVRSQLPPEPEKKPVEPEKKTAEPTQSKGSGIKLEIDKTKVREWDEVTVTWSGVETPSSCGWVGLFPDSTTPDTAEVEYKFIRQLAQGSHVWFIKEGTGTTFEFRLFPHGGHERKATSPTLTVEAGWSEFQVGLFFIVRPGADVFALWNNPRTPNPKGWIGLYANASAADTAYLSFQYMPAQPSGFLRFKMPETLSDSYELRYFPEGGYTKKDTSWPIKVRMPTPITLVATPNVVPPGGCVTVDWQISYLNGGLCVALYRAGAPEESEPLAVHQIQSCSSGGGALPFKMPMTPGVYEVRFMPYYPEVFGSERPKPVPITVTEPEKKPEEKKPETKKPDDMAEIKGIGPKITELLANAGIVSYAQLATAEVSRLKEILVAGGSRFATADPSTWPQQATLARDSKWDELKALRAKL